MFFSFSSRFFSNWLFNFMKSIICPLLYINYLLKGQEHFNARLLATLALHTTHLDTFLFNWSSTCWRDEKLTMDVFLFPTGNVLLRKGVNVNRSLE